MPHANDLQVFEMWCYRRMLRISWIHHITNDVVIQRIQKEPGILNTIKERKLAFFGHVLTNKDN